MRNDDSQPRTVREAFIALTVDDLKPLATLVDGAATRKGDLVDLLAKALEDPEKVRSMYERLDDVAQKGLQEAAQDSNGVLDRFRFHAKYGITPARQER